MRRIPLGMVLALALVVGACSQTDLRLETAAVGQSPGPSGGGPDPATVDPDDVIELALSDLGRFWDTTFPALYGDPFVPLDDLVPYGPDSPLPQCGPAPIDYDQIAANALYCPDEDLIAWDRVNLIPDLNDRFGPLTVGVVMAHEYAHAVQARAGVRGATVTLELQADCFAGAWAADVGDRLDVFATGDGALDQAIGGFLELRDTVGVSARDPNAHGTGFDRVSAFQDGFDTAGEQCVGYEDNPPQVIAIPFGSPTDLDQEGNLPLDELIDPLLIDLESFFTALFADLSSDWDPVDDVVTVDPATDEVDCGDETIDGTELEFASFYCVADDTIYLDNIGLVPALAEIGDFAFGGELARQFAFAAQSRLGILDQFADTALHADCVTGVYTAAQFLQTIPGQKLILSPGDVDEIITAFLAFGGGAETTAFERTAAFRTGFVDGFAPCEALLQN